MMAAVDLFGRPERARPSVQQLPLPLGWRLGEHELPQLLIGAANRHLIDAMIACENWSTPVAVLFGPPKSGKSLLAAHVGRQRPDIRIVDPVSAHDDTALFHMCTAAVAEHAPLLIVAAADWHPDLPDLATRIAAAQDFRVTDPDAELSAALIERQLAKHHLALSPEIGTYLGQRLERSYGAIALASDALATAALAQGRALSLPFVRDTLCDAGLLADDKGAGCAA